MAGALVDCEACGAITGAGCLASHVMAPNEEEVPRVRFGMEQHLTVFDAKAGDLANTCPSCQVPRGSFHHARCSLEECPTCSGGAWKCRCIHDRLLMV